MTENSDVWFPVKSDRKWLWDLPTCWQGWAVVIGWWVALIAGALFLPTVASPAVVLPVFIVCMCAVLFTICYIKGEPLNFHD